VVVTFDTSYSSVTSAFTYLSSLGNHVVTEKYCVTTQIMVVEGRCDASHNPRKTLNVVDIQMKFLSFALGATALDGRE